MCYDFFMHMPHNPYPVELESVQVKPYWNRVEIGHTEVDRKTACSNTKNYYATAGEFCWPHPAHV